MDFNNNPWQDKISSLKLGSGVIVTLCKESGCANPGKFGTSVSFGPLESPEMPGWGDSVSHIFVEKYEGGGVLAFRQDSCQVG